MTTQERVEAFERDLDVLNLWLEREMDAALELPLPERDARRRAVSHLCAECMDWMRDFYELGE
jgi:hypothetical protein